MAHLEKYDAALVRRSTPVEKPWLNLLKTVLSRRQAYSVNLCEGSFTWASADFFPGEGKNFPGGGGKNLLFA